MKDAQMLRIMVLVGLLCTFLTGPAAAGYAQDHLARSSVTHDRAQLEFAQARQSKKARRVQRNQVIIEQERLRIPKPTIAPSAGGSGTTYSDRVVGCTHGAGVAGISGLDRGPAIHNCAFGR